MSIELQRRAHEELERYESAASKGLLYEPSQVRTNSLFCPKKKETPPPSDELSMLASGCS